MLQKNRKAIHDNISSKIRLFFQIPDTTVAVTQQFARGIQKQSSDTYNNLKEQKKNGPGSGSGIYFFELFFFMSAGFLYASGYFLYSCLCRIWYFVKTTVCVFIFFM